jgi:glycosyltransferase involved in cell wall biosynthesis
MRNSYLFVGIALLAIALYFFLTKTRTKPVPPPTDKRKVLTWIIHMYPPYHNAGAEWMAHCLNRYLVKEHGYTIYVFIPSKNLLGYTYFNPATTYEGVHVFNMNDTAALEKATEYSTAICSHLNLSNGVRKYAKKHNKPYIHFLHNSFEGKKIRKWKETPHPTYLIANSEWISKFYSEFNFPIKVLYPPVFWQDYAVKRTNAKYVTLINLNKNKGGKILPEIARRLPDKQFAGVRGGYDKQVIDDKSPNITYFPNTPNIQEIYEQTKILLVPSAYESWGRVAVEAMSSGIPVIANPTPGLREALGNAGIFCHRDDIVSWVKEIKRLTEDSNYYSSMSAKALARAKELDPIPQMDALAKWFPSTSNPKMTH